MDAKHLSNLLPALSIFSLALTGGTLAPSVEATFRDSKRLAHDHYRKFVLVLFDKLIFHLDDPLADLVRVYLSFGGSFKSGQSQGLPGDAL
jgi:hypothetical protein